VARAVDRVTRPFRPTVAYAIDGVGCVLSALDGFTDFTTVDPVAFESGFEVGETRVGPLPGSAAEPVSWGATGFWSPASLMGITNGAATAGLVSLAPNDLSNGALPGPFSGSSSMWFGEAATGNYAGPLADASAGGTSAAAQQGRATSPYFSIPNLSNQVVLSFRSWFEIESVNPSSYDQMRVFVEDSVSGASTMLLLLNPPSDPGGSASLPYTSGGFNSAPVWAPFLLDMSLFAGKNVRLVFDFGTRDPLYNGFRGWLVDEVKVAALTPTPIAGPGFAAPARFTPSQARSLSAAPVPGARVWRP
jgi:hypothetical protein